MIITIMIPTMKNRKIQLNRLLDCLAPQLNDAISIQIYEDEGNMSIGQIRQYMVERVKTPYCVFIDDDDVVSPNYIESHLKALDSFPDAIGFKGEITVNGGQPRVFEHKQGNPYENYAVHFIRPISHINVIKTSIVKAVGYIDLKHGEDADFAIRLADSGLIERAEFIDDIMYYYLYNSNK